MNIWQFNINTITWQYMTSNKLGLVNWHSIYVIYAPILLEIGKLGQCLTHWGSVPGTGETFFF